ncbi:hypothetical protein ABK040_000136 [Willaertia magna]
MSSSENPFINLPDEVIHLIASFLIDNFSLDSTYRKRINSLEPLSFNSTTAKKTYNQRQFPQSPFSQPTPISSSFIYFHLIGRLSKSLYIRMHQPMFWREHVFPILLKNNALLQIEEEHLNDNKNNKACNKEQLNVVEDDNEKDDDEGILQNVSFLMNYCKFPKLLIKGFYHIKFLRHLFKQFENTLNNYSMNHLKVLNINIETFIVNEIIPNIFNNCNVLENLIIYSNRVRWDKDKFKTSIKNQSLNSLKQFEYHLMILNQNSIFDDGYDREIFEFYNLLIPFIPNLNYIHIPIINSEIMVNLSIYCKQLESMVLGGRVYSTENLAFDKNLIETIYNNNLTNLKVFVLKDIYVRNYDLKSFNFKETFTSLCELYQNTLQTIVMTSVVERDESTYFSELTQQVYLPKKLKHLNLTFYDQNNYDFIKSMIKKENELENLILDIKCLDFTINELNKLTKLKYLKLKTLTMNQFIKDMVQLKPNIPFLERIELQLKNNIQFNSENLIELLNNYNTIKHLGIYSYSNEQIKESDITKLLLYNNLKTFHTFDVEQSMNTVYYFNFYYWKDISLNNQLFKHLNEISIVICRSNLPQLITNIDNITVLNLKILEFKNGEDKSIKIIDNLELLVLISNFCKKLQSLTINSIFYTSNDKQLIDSEFKLFGNPLSLQHFSFTYSTSFALPENNLDKDLIAYLKTLSMCYILFGTSLDNSITSPLRYATNNIGKICDNYDLLSVSETEVFENLVMDTFSAIVNSYFTKDFDVAAIRNEFKSIFVDKTVELKENNKLKRLTLLSPFFKEIRAQVSDAKLQENFNFF